MNQPTTTLYFGGEPRRGTQRSIVRKRRAARHLIAAAILPALALAALVPAMATTSAGIEGTERRRKSRPGKSGKKSSVPRGASDSAYVGGDIDWGNERRPFALRMTPEQHERLKSMAYFTKTSMNDLILRAIEGFFDGEGGDRHFRAAVADAQKYHKQALDRLGEL